MTSKSTGIAIKSTDGVDLRNAEPKEEFSHVKAGPACCEVGPAVLSVTEKAAPGIDATGVGSVVRLNSDDQMPGPAYPHG